MAHETSWVWLTRRTLCNLCASVCFPGKMVQGDTPRSLAQYRASCCVNPEFSPIIPNQPFHGVRESPAFLMVMKHPADMLLESCTFCSYLDFSISKSYWLFSILFILTTFKLYGILLQPQGKYFIAQRWRFRILGDLMGILFVYLFE